MRRTDIPSPNQIRLLLHVRVTYWGFFEFNNSERGSVDQLFQLLLHLFYLYCLQQGVESVSLADVQKREQDRHSQQALVDYEVSSVSYALLFLTFYKDKSRFEENHSPH